MLTCGNKQRAEYRLGWLASNRNPGRNQIGMVAGFKSESPAGFESEFARISQ